jgi:hypothetical protein
MWLRTDMSGTGTPLIDVVTGQADGEATDE